MTHTRESAAQDTYDVAVIGGGAAGLGAALTLGRARRAVLVVDGGEPRNAPADGIHAYLGQEGTPPAELLATGRAEVRRYGGRFLDGTVASAERDGAGFRVVLADGRAVRGARLLVATGLTDELPPVPGLAEGWGTDVLHCPYCHGWEVRDQAVGVLSTGPLAVQQALLWRQWSEDVTLFLHTGPEPDDEEYEQLAARGIAVVDGTVEGLERTESRERTGPGERTERDGGRLSGVRLDGGTVVACRALVVAPRFAVRAGFLAPLGLEPVEAEREGVVIGTHLPADATGRTPVDGVWAAGNAADPLGQVISAAAAASRAGAALNADLVAEETRRAVEARAALAPAGS
ncbi:NAD(P)/FAD-dependent oxidoreductase [Streptomyces albiaxialis]|uniref:NAD(P)/FAD-dependent oxidoreductase n=1 Tax=Streptomyces albiaxialis TaxID=329523 RepID=A0ABN2X080_9ACTN